MSGERAVEALKRLGLGTYEAEVFVALQQIGTGTAAAISDVSDVPRSQVYGAAGDLVERGLLERIESSPKRYRAVDLETARDHLARRQDRVRERAFDELSALDPAPPEADATQTVSTLRGRRPISERVTALVDGATSEVGLVAPDARDLTADIERALRDRAAGGVTVTVVTTDRSVEERFSDSAVRVVLMPADSPADYTGRTLMVDEEAVLLSVVTTDSAGVEEEAMWTAGTNIARILAAYVHSGMESGLDDRASRSGPE